MTNLLQVLADDNALLTTEALQAVKGGNTPPPDSCWMFDD